MSTALTRRGVLALVVAAVAPKRPDPFCGSWGVTILSRQPPTHYRMSLYVLQADGSAQLVDSWDVPAPGVKA